MGGLWLASSGAALAAGPFGVGAPDGSGPGATGLFAGAFGWIAVARDALFPPLRHLRPSAAP